MQKCGARLGIISTDRCKPNKCKLECKHNCPVVKIGKNCIQADSLSDKAYIIEHLCIGCGICVKKCPFRAIQIVNVPDNLKHEIFYKYGLNSFQLHNLPVPKRGYILGIIGTNAIGKSTALKILAGKLLPNFGKYDEIFSYESIKKKIKGNELQNYFDFLRKKTTKLFVKPQYIDIISERVREYTGLLLLQNDLNNMRIKLIRKLSMVNILNRKISSLSGGELQRFIISFIFIQKANIILIDEPSSYLDIKQRLCIAGLIRNMIIYNPDIYIVVIEHDLSIVDYLSDFIVCLYGLVGAYGVASIPYSVKEGINIFIMGYIPSERMRFRDSILTFSQFKGIKKDIQSIEKKPIFNYPKMILKIGMFRLLIDHGEFLNSEIIILLGENGCGKSSFIKSLGGFGQHEKYLNRFKNMNISYKPQKIFPLFTGTVRDLLFKKNNFFELDLKIEEFILKPLQIHSFMDKKISNLSGGELQRLSIMLCLEKKSDIILIDEPSAYLDAEQRLIVSRVIKKFAEEEKKSIFIVEHDFIMLLYLATRIIVFEGIPSLFCKTTPPLSINKGLNLFLKELEVTFRLDKSNLRPRINKYHSIKDKEQKKEGNFYFNDI